MSLNVSFNNYSGLWNYWFAGLVDGDGCFYKNKGNEVSLEITTHIFDEKVLALVKNGLKGGSVKLRSNSQSVRYRVKAKAVVVNALQRLDGKLLNAVRLNQYKQACLLLNYQPLSPSPSYLGLHHTLNPKDMDTEQRVAYLAGLIDSDGTVTITVSHADSQTGIYPGVEGKIQRLMYSRGFNQLTLKIAGIDQKHIETVRSLFNYGRVYVIKPTKSMKSDKHQYHWYIRTEEEFNSLIFDLKTYFPLRSVKMHRLRLVHIYYKYKSLGYHLSEPGTTTFKLWEKFCRSWHKYSY